MGIHDGPILFLVPARGGSKRVPHKNVVAFAGRPLIAHVLTAARAAMALLDRPGSRLVVSTDDPNIAQVAREWGAEVPVLRPPALALDESPDIDALIHMLDWLEIHERYVPDVLVELQAPSPLVTPADICGAIRMFDAHGGDPVLTVSPSQRPPFWSCTLEDDRIRTLLVAGAQARRQSLPPTFEFNGAVSVIAPATLRERRTFLTERTRGYVMPPDRSLDIDTPTDLLWGEFLHGRVPDAGGASREIEVAGRRIGAGHPCFVIAEAGVNHNGDLARAHSLVDAAAEAGADAVKFQTFRSEALCAAEAPKEQYQLRQTGSEQSQLDMLRALELPAGAWRELSEHAQSRDLVFLSTPFDEESADRLEQCGVPAFKVGSGEVTHVPLLRHLARKGRPILLSTGMCTLDEVGEAVRVLRHHGDPPLALFHCVSCYPAEAADCNLNAMVTLRQAFGVPVGFSDHTLGMEIPAAAAALGANLLEKHLTLDRRLPGPDHQASLEPEEFRRLVQTVRHVEAALGDGMKVPRAAEGEGRRLGRRSLYAAVPIGAGQVITPDMLAVRRPGTGLPPRDLDRWVGRRARQDFPAGALLTEP